MRNMTRIHHCRTCDLRFNTSAPHGVTVDELDETNISFSRVRGTRLLSLEQAVAVHSSPESSRKLAKKLGVSYRTIVGIRAGDTYADAYRVAYGKDPSPAHDHCSKCRHWIEHTCLFDFDHENGTWAAQCALYALPEAVAA